MPVTRLADVFIPAVYASLGTTPDPVKFALLTSGIAVSNPALLEAFNGGGKFLTMPRWNPIPRGLQPNMSDDDPARFAVPNKVNMTSMQARKAWFNQGFSEADLTQELAGASPLQFVRNSFGTYWNSVYQRRLTATVVGLYKDNVASNNGDMTVDVTAANAAAITDTNRFTQGAMIDAAFTLGDQFSNVGAILMHTMVYRQLILQEKIVPPSAASFNLPTYMGKLVLFDDDMPVEGDATSGFKYLTVLFGRGAIGYALGTHGVPVELERDPRAANGAGVTTLWERRTMMIHPYGYNWTDADITPRETATPGFAGPEISPTEADLAKPANWERSYPRKAVPLAFLRTN